MNNKWLRHQHHWFQYCPHCKADVKHTPHKVECPRCPFVSYNNPAVAVAVIISQNKQILLGQRGQSPQKGNWDLIGGFIEAGETAEQAVMREVTEETGLNVKVCTYIAALPDLYGNTKQPTLNLTYQARIVSGQIKAQDDVAALKWFDIQKLPQNIAFDHVKKAITIYQQRTRDDTVNQNIE